MNTYKKGEGGGTEFTAVILRDPAPGEGPLTVDFVAAGTYFLRSLPLVLS
jgi:hypothetical protein